MPTELVLVTQAASGMGIALLRALLPQSDRRILAHDCSQSEELAELVKNSNGRITLSRADLCDPDSQAHFMNVVAEQGVPSAIVHLPAALFRYEAFGDLTWTSVQANMDLDMHGSMVLLQRLLPEMTALPRGRVVFMLSSVVQGVPPKFVAQATLIEYAKLGFMRALAAEYAASSIRINAVLLKLSEAQVRGDTLQLSPGKRAAASSAITPDVIGAIQFLLSPATDYISGVTLPLVAGSLA